MTVPRAGWLHKLSALPFGRCRWQRRFFVLLDSELRCYKDEHAVMPSHTISLHQVSHIVATSTPGHLHSFRLELSEPAKHQKIWTLECQSKVELEAWMEAIEFRLVRLAAIRYPSSCGSSPLMPVPPLSPSQNQQILPAPQQPALSLSALPFVRPRKSATSISRRRGILLSPILIQQQLPHLAPLESSLVSSESTCSLLQSPPLVDSLILDSPKPNDDPENVEPPSPTFLVYKQRFRL